MKHSNNSKTVMPPSHHGWWL